MLQFNPGFRPTAKECLRNPIFDSLNVDKNVAPPEKFYQQIYKKGTYDYHKREPINSSIKDYEGMMIKELKEIQRLSRIE